jgi:hypothetical protein
MKHAHISLLRPLFLCGLFLSFAGCNFSKKSVAPDQSTPDWPVNTEAATCSERLVIDFESEVPLAGVHIEHVQFQSPCLEIKYYYSGCATGEHVVSWDGRLSEGYPPLAFLQLMVTETGECDQLHEETILLDISELKRIAGKKFYVQLNEMRQNRFLISFID